MKRCRDLGKTGTRKLTRRALSALDIVTRRRGAAAAWRGGRVGVGQRPSCVLARHVRVEGEVWSRKSQYCRKMCRKFWVTCTGVTSKIPINETANDDATMV